MKPRIQPIGVAVLKVMKQVLVRYQLGEIGYVENLMAFENRRREHRRLRQTEEIVTIERERTEEGERDLQSTERFELQQESQRTIQSETKFEAGAEVSASYGPVQIGAYARFSSSQTKTESDRNATNYAKSITERSLSRLVERVREERTTRTLEEFEERNEHGFDNTGDENRSGIYRWLDKWYRAKVIDYGKRLFYEFIVPEPAAFYVFAKTYNFESRPLPPLPEVPRNLDEDGEPTDEELQPAHITRDNYLLLASLNDAQGITPPPADQVVVARTVAREFGVDQPFAVVDNDIEIPEGYVLEGLYWSQFVNRGPEDYDVVISVGRQWRELTPDDRAGNSVNLPTLNGVVPVAMIGLGISGATVMLHIYSRLTDEAFEKWQLQTHDAIMNAYRSRVVDYEEKLAASQIEGGAKIGGNNPMINRQIEQEELKKGCITLWTGFRYNGLPGITQNENGEPPNNYPEIHIDNSLELTPEIQFLEQSFDWKNMTYEFHPYHWGRKKNWPDVLAQEDLDPLFNDFLHAGAARVLVPVHRAATEAVLYYQLTGMLWSGGDVPFFTPPDPSGDIVSNVGPDEDEEGDELALYNAYLAELRADGDGAVDDIDREIEISPDDPETWLYRVPTTLVMLQADATLPDTES